MDEVLKEIIEAIKANATGVSSAEELKQGIRANKGMRANKAARKTTQNKPVDDTWLAKLIHRHNGENEQKALAAGIAVQIPSGGDAWESDPDYLGSDLHIRKRNLLPYYLKTKETDPDKWASWGVDDATEQALIRLLQMKPRRSASGLATITVVTKPWPCSSNCIYCPSDIRMPKSYLADEPACQRAERNFFDPYLQVQSRLRQLSNMGHTTDKIELIVLGGTWSDYPIEYQLWFASELFRALNDGLEGWDSGAIEERRSFYEVGAEPRDGGGSAELRGELRGESHGEQGLVDVLQAKINAGECTYNEAIAILLGQPNWQQAAEMQKATLAQLEAQQKLNEHAQCRVVGLCVETRPDLITQESAEWMRRLGCTKVQMGIQSLNQEILCANQRKVSIEQIEAAFSILRRFGFKILIHFMLNLYQANPASDKQEYLELISDERFLPDEVKLYPCSLVESSQLTSYFEQGLWEPYTEEELLDVLEYDVRNTPAYVRISRMIRDIPSTDILTGNKKPNLRQLVEARIAGGEAQVAGSDVRAAGSKAQAGEIRQREVATTDIELEDLHLEDLTYHTRVSTEHFMQWVTQDGKLAGFLRLSLPEGDANAMIREVHIYGRVSGLAGRELRGQDPDARSKDETTSEDETTSKDEATSEDETTSKDERTLVGHDSGAQRLTGMDLGGVQHQGLGHKLVEAACEIAREQGYKSIKVISSVGTREYYRSLGFVDVDLYQQRSL